MSGVDWTRGEGAPAAKVPILKTFNYYGGKSELLHFLFAHFPAPSTKTLHFIDLFGGSGVVAANVSYKVVTYNDRNEEVVNFFRMLRDRPDDLLSALYLTPHCRREFQRSMLPVAEDYRGDQELEMVRRFAVRVSQSIGCKTKHNSWSTRHRDKTAKFPYGQTFMPRLVRVVERFRNIQIECKDALVLLEKLDYPTNFIYCDPPYPTHTRVSRKDYGSYDMPDSEHVRFASALKGVSEAKVALSSYPSRIYDDLGWERVDYHTHAKTGGDPRVESLYMNYESARGLFK